MHTDAIQNFEFPHSLRELRSFMGARTVNRRFTKSFAAFAPPLNCFTRKDADTVWDCPTKEELQDFETLKEKMTSSPVLAISRAGKTYMLDTDAPAYQLGYTLLHKQDGKTWKHAGSCSYSLNSPERNYSATKRNCYGFVRGVSTWSPYIEGTRFIFRIDNDALRCLMLLTETFRRLTR